MTNEERMMATIDAAKAWKNWRLQEYMNAKDSGKSETACRDLALQSIDGEKQLASLLHVNGEYYMPNLMSIASLYIEIGEYFDAMSYLDTIVRLAMVRSLRNEAQRMRNEASDALAAKILRGLTP